MSTPKRPWAQALPAVKDRTVAVYARAQRREMARIFTGGKIG